MIQRSVASYVAQYFIEVRFQFAHQVGFQRYVFFFGSQLFQRLCILNIDLRLYGIIPAPVGMKLFT